ncbi:tripartite motif-containing protein 2-like [Saccostrea echinata]|uniref:tripartite motif-containing protein 2-like n=1 Tax=Saccostrea echinata TaxID=191078 RepID=UPI002A7FD110|nr:tripartite motif-containing protein 2-like [Saccostrea echinata]
MAETEFEVVAPSNIPQVSLAPDQLSRKFLMCHVCNEQYNEDGKHPRLLPCLHTLCFDCLNKTKVNDELQCPTCKIKHSVTNVDKVCPRDNTRRDLMDFVKVKRAPSAVSCSSCPSNVATHRCRECAEFLCVECQKAHERVSATKGHTLILLEKLKQSQDLDAFCRQLMCSDHNKDLQLYCTKDTCQKPVCMMCAIVTCKESNGHVIESAETVAKERRKDIKTQKTSMEKVGKEVEQVIGDVKSEQRKVDDLRKKVEGEIDETFDKLIQIIERGRADQKKALEDSVMTKQDNLKTQEKELKRMKGEIEESSNFTDQALAYTNAAALLQIDHTIDNRLNALTKQFFDKEPHEMATFGFHAKGLISEIQSKVVEMAKVWSVSAFPPNCKIGLEEELEENKSTTFVVNLRDFQKKTPFKDCDLDVCDVKAVVKDPKGTETEILMKMKHGSKDEMEVTIKPAISGRHVLEIKVLDRVVVRKEFECKPAVVRSASKKEPPPRKETTPKKDPPINPKPPGIQKPDLTFDKNKAHRDVSISPDGKIFKNLSSGEQTELVPNNSRLQKYKGAICSSGLQYPGRFKYAIKIGIHVKKPLDKSNLVFELGIARKSVIGKSLVVEGEKYAWSMIGAHHVDCDAICLHIAHNNHLLYHEVLTSNAAGSSMERTFGFLLDTEFGQWKVFDKKLEKEICVVEAVDCSELLYPVVAGYNPSSVEVTATIVHVD